MQGLTYLGSLIQISLCWLELELLISADVSAIFATLDWQLYNTGTLQKRQWQWLKLVLVISHDQPDFQFEQTIFSWNLLKWLIAEWDYLDSEVWQTAFVWHGRRNEKKKVFSLNIISPCNKILWSKRWFILHG